MVVDRRTLSRPLLAWFRRNARDLPWRQSRDPYRIWLSEVILQQTRVSQGLPYYERFLAAFPDVNTLASASEERVFKLWEGLGYYARARNLLLAAKMIVNEYGGRFPRSAKEWLSLPGIGRYTAGAIASIAFGERVAVLDGNVKRVLSRVFNIADCIDTPAVERRMWTLAESLVPAKHPGDFNQAIMELGAGICVPRRPACSSCPVARHCEARAAGTENKRPVRKKRAPVPHEDRVVAIVKRGNRCLLGRRPPEGLLGGLWEFPGNKVEESETHAQALRRGARSQLGATVRVGRHLATVTQVYSHLRVTLHVYNCTFRSETPKPCVYTAFAWVHLNGLWRYALPKAQLKILAVLREPGRPRRRQT